MAQGAPVSSGNVTAFFDGIAENSVIAVSRYSGVDPRNPIGSIVAGNPLRVNGGSAGEINENCFSFDDRTASPAMGSASQTYSATPHSDYEDWVEISEDTFGSVTSLAVQDQPIPSASSIPLNGVHGDGVDWAVIGVEIKPGTPEYRFERIFTGGIEGISIDPANGIYPGFTQASLKALSPAGMNL
jgi:hypothetical protein